MIVVRLHPVALVIAASLILTTGAAIRARQAGDAPHILSEHEMVNLAIDTAIDLSILLGSQPVHNPLREAQGWTLVNHANALAGRPDYVAEHNKACAAIHELFPELVIYAESCWN